MSKKYEMKDHNNLLNKTHATILLNTGSPEELKQAAVKQFIGDMLSDEHVMGMPNFIRVPLARGIIAPFRASSSLERYKLIWGQGLESPLLRHSRVLASTCEELLCEPVELSMRYGLPNITTALSNINSRNLSLDSVTLFPLFPQFAVSSYYTAVEDAVKRLQANGFQGRIRVVKPYYNHPAYIKCVADGVRGSLEKGFDMLLFSFHSLPLSQIEEGEKKGVECDYKFQCLESARLIAQELGVSQDKYSVVWASAIGNSWQRPYMDEVVASLPSQGVSRLVITAPGFIVDNLESLYDLGCEAKDIFLKSGGVSFEFAHCVNESFAESIVMISRSELVDWKEK
ncbi:MAG: ferrochelatase [Bacteroidales bacterium]